ncbi:hypothetical protein Bpfe_001260 [Biomphalaria pfeifferi]|uniref:C-type lectin domain-containing protein n=1 Tax=Biomphalaria pfeifferi TaxID=112525 RepID=A0AAD8FM73_BIOPF|nr:hypothetical protein Bpfe_001260 [Biomphalaria pfeifferi]
MGEVMILNFKLQRITERLKVISQESTKESPKESLYLKPCIVLEGVCYRCLFSTIDFSEYEEKCSDPYRDIAKFNSSNVLEQVTERCTGKYGTLRWVAARKLKDTSEFVWLADNSPIEKEFWAPMFPLDSNGDCVALDVKEMKLKNIYCRYTFPYICSYSTSRRTVERTDSKRSLVLGIVVAMLTFCLICTSILGTTLYYTAQKKAKKRKTRKRYTRTNEKPAGNKTPKTMQRKSQEQRQWETNLKVVRAQLVQANKEQKKKNNKVLLSKQGRKPYHHPSVSSTVVMTLMSQRSYKELCERRSNENEVSNSFTIQMTNETDKEDHKLVPGSSIKEGPETTTQKSQLSSSRLNKFKGDISNVQMSNLATQGPKEKPSKSSNDWKPDERLRRLVGHETAPRKSVEGWNLKVKDINADQESEEPGPVLNSKAESCILL